MGEEKELMEGVDLMRGVVNEEGGWVSGLLRWGGINGGELGRDMNEGLNGLGEVEGSGGDVEG